MRIKHFSGYGSVNAKKVLVQKGVNEYGEAHTLLIIDVAGDHERGLIPYIKSDAAAWLLKYFDKPAAAALRPWACNVETKYTGSGVRFFISYNPDRITL